MSTGYDRPLYILALDHRTSYERKLFGLEGPPTPDDRQRLAEGKEIILDGLLAAAEAAPPGTVGALIRFDGDRQRRADGFAQLAGDAALLAVLVAAQGVQAAKAWRQRRLFLGELHRDLAAEGVLAGDGQALEQLDQHEAGQEVLERKSRRQGNCLGGHGGCYFQMLYGVCIHAPITTSQTSVTGMKIFQPRRMIWS